MFSKTHSTRVLSAILILLIACNMAGFVLWQTARVASYRYVRLHRQSIAMRDTLSIPTTVFRDGKTVVWHKDDEIAYGEEMFDIKQQYTQGENIILIGHYDRFENKLFKVLYKMLDGSNDDDKQTVRTLWHFDAVIPAPINIISQFANTTTLQFTLPVIHQLSGYATLPYSPPDACFTSC